ncbi:hypothetical protein NKH18_31815 [Streptomyces sp. M10(2022)]
MANPVANASVSLTQLPGPMRSAVPEASLRAPSTRRWPYWDMVQPGE